MAISRKAKSMATSNQNDVSAENSTDEIVQETIKEPRIFASRWIQKYGSKYPKDAMGSFKYRVDKYALGTMTPSEWQGLFEGTIPFPAKV